MALGSADGYEGSVAFGSVLNSNEYEILITANISGGNSGGPLVDNEGRVVGTTSWSSTKEQYNGAMSLNAMCRKIIECDGKYYWDYEE
jgi:S1-C subfamily serine protease